MKAQIARGADMESGNLIQRQRNDSDPGSAFLYPHSAVPMILQWQWKQDVIAAAMAEPR